MSEVIAILFLGLVCTVPGIAMTRILDPTSDKFRRALLSPALGLLLCFGVSGWLVILTGFWSSWGLLFGFALLNLVAIWVLKRGEVEGKELSPWLRLEAAMGIEVEAQLILNDDERNEVDRQHWFQGARSKVFPWSIMIAIIICLLPLILFKIPHGVDWIGFSFLSNRFLISGGLELPSPSIGNWTYPPAFPAMAAWLQSMSGLDAFRANQLLGQICLLAVLLGIAGAGDRHGAGAHMLLAMGFAAGLFAKTHDSGWPTIASQLGLVLGLLVLLRPNARRGKNHTLGFVIAVVSVAVIHPTGAIYLGALMFTHILIARSLSEHSRAFSRLLTTCAILLTIACVVILLLLAPRMIDSPVFSEYGWQGGRPMLVYTGLLFPLAMYAGFRLKHTVEGRLLLGWIAVLWLISVIHLAEGLEKIPILSLLSYSLYSMGMHAFHIPMAALVGLWWSNTTSLTQIEGENNLMVGTDPTPETWVAISLMAILVVQVISAQVALVMISSHDELLFSDEDDQKIMKRLEDLPAGSIVYSENSHWGYLYAAPSDVGLTSYPSLGLVDTEFSIQAEATLAIRQDKIDTLRELGITHAYTNPLGEMNIIISSSPWWRIIAEEGGSKLWALRNTLGVNSESHFIEIISDEMRLDPWKDLRYSNILDDEVAFLSEGSLSLNDLPDRLRGIDLSVNLVYCQGPDVTTSILDVKSSKAGCGMLSTTVEDTWVGSILIDVDGGGELWLNPLGLSGRSDRIIDETGSYLYLIELRPI